MPEISLLGWFHTIIAFTALVCGFYTLAVYKLIHPETRTGRIYLVCTLIAAATALMIYRHNGFGPAHALAVLTLLALAGGYLVSRIPQLEIIAPYFQAFCYSGTLLFHMIPAITDGLLRLPVGAPLLTDPHDPVLKVFYLTFVIVFIVGYFCQFLWIKKRTKAQSSLVS